MRSLRDRAAAAVAVGLALAVGASLAIGVLAPAAPASAASATQFDPGMIITDSLFFNGSAASAAQVQSVLDAKVGICRAGYTCVKAYKETTHTIAADPMCGTYTGGANETAATIIYKVGKACGVSQKVLIVLLQKEQGLITDDWPVARQYRSATGYGCPDTADCDSEYYGFFNQVYKAAWAFKRYSMPPGTGPGTNWYSVYNRYAPNKTVNVLYNPNSACGSKSVAIKNQATASLYYYTPYTPNTAALSAGYGMGDSCSAYGNRNFFLYYADWFGSPSGYSVGTDFRTVYAANTGALGDATSGVKTSTANGGGSYQLFRKGAIFKSAKGTFALSGAVYAEYIRRGGVADSLGWPAGAVKRYTENGGGEAQPFASGEIYSSAAGAYAVRLDLRAGYLAQGGPKGALGWPKTGAVNSSLKGGGSLQEFTKGTLYYSSAVSASASTSAVTPARARALIGAIKTEYDRRGGLSGNLGWPTGDAVSSTANGGGASQAFQGGDIYSSAAGAYAVRLDMRDVYLALNGPAGALGWPMTSSAASTANGGGSIQKFTGGTVYYTAAGGPHAMSGAVLSEYLRRGGETGTLGWPVGDASKFTQNGGGTVQRFQGGGLYSSTSGTFAVRDEILNAYDAAGGQKGMLSWPTMDAKSSTANGGGAIQRFTGGTVYYTAAKGAHAMTGAVLAEYLRRGGEAGTLGWPAGDAEKFTESGGGTVQQFQSGKVYSSAAGTYAVRLDILNAYDAAGGQKGILGWPTTGATNSKANGGGAIQRFTGGTVYYTAAKGAHAMTGAVLAEYLRRGGEAGTLGWPVGNAKHSTGTEGGDVQEFQSGGIYSSASGAYAVRLDLRAAYLAQGAQTGRLGWPTGSAKSAGTGVSAQTFQHGTIRWSAKSGAVVQ
jgi:uncharacterized protein with LGFP repeats